MSATNTKHSCQPEQRAFGRRAEGCPRCDELKNGAPARDGWQKAYFGRKAEERRQSELMDQNVRNGLCVCGARKGHAVVCTFGEW